LLETAAPWLCHRSLSLAVAQLNPVWWWARPAGSSAVCACRLVRSARLPVSKREPVEQHNVFGGGGGVKGARAVVCVHVRETFLLVAHTHTQIYLFKGFVRKRATK
jgi:hypothetical protein